MPLIRPNGLPWARSGRRDSVNRNEAARSGGSTFLISRRRACAVCGIVAHSGRKENERLGWQRSAADGGVVLLRLD